MQAESQIEQKPVRWGVVSTANIGVKAVAPAIIASSMVHWLR
jgi:hypothetical protein